MLSTPLFSGLAFGGLVISIFYQRKELIDTRREFALQTKALDSQYKEAQFQRNMNALYQQISLVHNTEQAQIEKLRGILKSYRNATETSKEPYFKQVKDNIWHAHVAIERTTTLLKLAQYIIDSKSWVTSEGDNQKRIELVRMLVVGNVPSRIGTMLTHHSSEILRGISYQEETQHGGAPSITKLVGLYTDLTIDTTAHNSSNL